MTRDEGFRRLAMALDEAKAEDKEDDIVFKLPGNSYVVENGKTQYSVWINGQFIGTKVLKSDAIALCKKRARVGDST